jgi:flagellar assembly protein FliH
MRSRIIAANGAQVVDRWASPTVDPTAADALRGAAQGGAHMLTAGQVDVLTRQAQDEARQRGYDEGLAAGKAELTARAERLSGLLAAFSHPFQSLEHNVEEELVAVAVSLAAHLVRREIEHDPALLQAAVHDCLAVLSTSVRDVTVYLNPDDAVLVRGQVQTSAEQRFKIAADAELARGDLRVASSSSLVDGSLAARCREIIAAARAATPTEE